LYHEKDYYLCLPLHHPDVDADGIRLYTATGDSVLIASYDPWGNRTTTKNTLKFHRGFTGHEHLTTYGVINMNGRMYDPTVGRFLAPDNFVQMSDFSQSFNRYSYCLNNPLKYTDPSGELFGIDDAFLIFTLASSTISGMAHASMQGKKYLAGRLERLCKWSIVRCWHGGHRTIVGSWRWNIRK
jgi:RHS repeat-associated protein